MQPAVTADHCQQIPSDDLASVADRNPPDVASEEAEFEQIWPNGPLAIDAYDVYDLADSRSVDVIRGLLELCFERNRTEVIILNLEHLMQNRADREAVDQMYLLKGFLFQACRQLDIPMPRLLLERNQGNLDLRIFPRRAKSAKSNVVNFKSASKSAARHRAR